MQICFGFMAFEEKASPYSPVGTQGMRLMGLAWGWALAARQVVRWELWGEVSRAQTPRAL